MNFRNHLKSFLAGVLFATLLFATSLTVFAAPLERTITAVYDGIKIYIDGVLIQPKDAAGNTVEPFTYNGTTYLPVRAIANALGKDVKWDGATKSVYLGKSPDGYVMSDIIKPYLTDGASTNEAMTMGSKKYYKGYQLKCYNPRSNSSDITSFNLDGKYSSIQGLIGIDDQGNYLTNDDSIDVLIYSDDSLIKNMQLKKGDLPKPLELNVQGAVKLTVELRKAKYSGCIIDMADLIIK